MALLRLRRFGDPVLTTRAQDVDRVDESVRALAADMLATMDASRGVGLAANQVGVAKRVFVYGCQGMRGVMINPVWQPLGVAFQTGSEGCLSIPGVRGEVTRHQDVLVRGVDEFGRAVVIRASGLLARCIQHETDHLDGVLFLTRMEPAQRKAAMAKIRAAEWFQA